jgi:AcrR family transcriptional regulator
MKQASAGPVPQARGERVIKRVLDATLEELVRVGFRALRIEDVSARAGVHKTTIYRRWPTKNDLVRDAMVHASTHTPKFPNTGSVRDDLIEVARGMCQFMRSKLGQGLFRVLIAEGRDPEVGAICDALRSSKESVGREWVRQAVARGDLAPSIEADLLFSTLVGTLHHRLVMRNQPADDAFIGRLVDLLLEGAGPRGSTRAASSAGRARRRS